MKSAVRFTLAAFFLCAIVFPTNAVQIVTSLDSDESAETASEKNSDKQKEDSKDKHSKSGAYAIEMISTGGGNWCAVRYHKHNGKSWKMGDGQWIAIKELKQLRPEKSSTYEVKLISAQNGRFSATRIDVNSGQCWELKEEVWHPILDEAD